MNRTLVPLALVAAAALGLAACAAEPTAAHGTASTSSSTTTTTSPEVTPEDEETTPEPEETTEEAEEDEGPAVFGQGYTWDDGLGITVSKPAHYSPSDSSAGTEGFKTFVAFTVTVKNGTKTSFDPSLFTANASSGEDESDEVFDSAKGIEGSPETKILPGRTKHWKIVFGYHKGQEFTLEVSPDFGDHSEAVWSGTVK